LNEGSIGETLICHMLPCMLLSKSNSNSNSICDNDIELHYIWSSKDSSSHPK